MDRPATASTFMLVFRDAGGTDQPLPEVQRQSFQRWLDWVASMRAKGQYVAGEPLEPGRASVLRGAPKPTITDGPFAEAKEVVGGFMLIRAADLAEAVAIARDCPGLSEGGSVEVRQVMPIPR